LKKNKTLITVIAHILAWICFLSLPYIFQPRPRGGQVFTMSDNMIATFICINAFLFGFYYLNTLVLIPKLFKPRKWLLYTASIVVCFFLFMFAPKPIANAIAEPEDATAFFKSRNLPEPSPEAEKRFNKRRNITHYPSSYFAFVLVFAVGLAASSIQEWIKSEDAKKEMEHEKVNTELSLLKSQINPHFFFNTLNNIYSLAIVKSDETASSILKLSAIMRYVLTETDQKYVSLANEIDFLQNYINLQSVRLTDKVKLTVNVNGDIENKQVAPLLFIPFVENAFKYGVSTVESSEITIRLNSTATTVQFFVQNHIVKGTKQSTVNTGIGIVNVKRRLELLYPGKHVLSIDDKNNLYTVNLEIELE
jgi:two-component system, LytTR family, sensor kinase